MIVTLEPYVLTDFSGGLDTKSNPLRVQPNKTPYTLNCHTNVLGAVSGRNGFAELNTNTETGNTNGLYDYPVNQTTRMLMQMRGTTLYSMDSLDGTWDTVTMTASMANDQIEFDTFDLGTGSNRLIIACQSGTNQMQYWDGTGSTVAISDAQAGTPRYMKIWNQRIFAVGDNTDPNNLRWSDSGSATAWTAASNADIITNDGDFVTGLGILKKNLFVFKRYSIHRVTFTGGDPLVEISPVILGTGCIASKTIKNVNVPELGEVLVFLTTDGRIVAFSGHSEGLVNLSDVISVNNNNAPISMAQLNTSQLATAHAVTLPSKYWYMCFVPSSGSTLPDYCLVFDYLSKGWWPWSNMKFGASAEVRVSNDTRVYAQGHNTLQTFRLDNGNSDNGSSINRVYFTPRIKRDSTSIISSSRGAQVTVKQIGNYNINFHNRLDWDTGWSDATTISMLASSSVLGDVLPITLGGSESVVSHVDVPKLKNLIQFKVETTNTNPPWTLYGLEELSSARGYHP